MTASRCLRRSRRRAGLSQRELARRSGIPQPTIARIETGRASPRFDTMDTLLAACGDRIAVVSRRGEGVDRTAIRELLKLNPGERAARAVEEARNLARLDARLAR